MVKGVINFAGAKLTEARLARGLSKKSLAEAIGVSPMAITRYEANQDRPTVDRLTALAGALSIPFEFFTRRPWPEDIGPVFWRLQAAETKWAREMTEQRIKWICELFWVLEEELNFPDVQVPSFDIPDDCAKITPAMIEDISLQVRLAWKLRDLPIRDIVLSIESAGIPVVMLNIPSEKQDGFQFWSDLLNRGFIGINTNEVTAARARFDAAHELGHLILHRKVTAAQKADPSYHKLLERQAHRFAGSFIFPRERFFDEVPTVSLEYFASAKKRWGLSVAAMINRACDLGMIGSEEKTRLFISMSRRGWRGAKREPFDNVMEIERPRMLQRGLATLLSSGEYSEDFLENTLNLPSDEVSQIVGSVPYENPRSNLSELKPRIQAKDLESGNVVRFRGR